MKRSYRRSKQTGGDVPGQLQINWTEAVAAQRATESSAAQPKPPNPATAATLVQRLPWDFRKSFPAPTPEAIHEGIISEDDAQPENLRAIHDEHAGALLATLCELDVILDARRRGVDPRTGKPPTSQAAKERLRKLFASKPDQLKHEWRILMETYESAFGPEAADAFDKALRARHAGIEVVAEQRQRPATRAREIEAVHPAPSDESQKNAPGQAPRTTPARHERPRRRAVARLPVPKPLPAAVAAGHFGRDERGPIRPTPDEVRAITENHAEKLIDLLEHADQGDPNGAFKSALAAYAEDFGARPTDQLEAYVRREFALRAPPTTGRSPRR